MDYNLYMKKPWHDPVKGQPPAPETLAIKGDWNKFTGDMKKVFQPQPRKPVPAK
jgi:hypothetical protein